MTSMEEVKAVNASLRDHLLSSDTVKRQQAFLALNEYVRCYTAQNCLVPTGPLPSYRAEVVCWVDGFVPVFKHDLDSHLLVDLRKILSDRVDKLYMALPEEDFNNCRQMILSNLPESEMMRLYAIARFADKAVSHSSGYHASWEFDEYSGCKEKIDGQTLHDTLKSLLTYKPQIEQEKISPELARLRKLEDTVKQALNGYAQPFAHNSEGDRLKYALRDFFNDKWDGK